MSLLTTGGLLVDHATTSNAHEIMNKLDEDAKIDATNREADKANDADKPDGEATDSEKSTHTKEHKAQRVDHHK